MASTARKRGANKGIVKKRVAKVESILTEVEQGRAEPDHTELRHLKQHLQEKADLISKLDEEILDEIQDEEDMMKHIEEADEFRLFIYNAISPIDALISTACSERSVGDSER
jgi:phosphoglycerate-specific signal transduction histidine kinase